MKKNVFNNKIIEITERYNWEIELKDGTIVTDHNDFNFNDVIRVSFIPTIGFLPRHDVVVDGFKVRKRFARGFIAVGKQGYKEYLHVLVTNSFRLYLKSSTGQVIITPRDYEMRI